MQFELKRVKPCPVCGGSGRVRGMVLTLSCLDCDGSGYALIKPDPKQRVENGLAAQLGAELRSAMVRIYQLESGQRKGEPAVHSVNRYGAGGSSYVGD